MSKRLPLYLAIAALALLGAFAAVAPVPQAEADTAFDISFFYTPLATHGEWVVVQPYGWTWVPERVDYGWRPYTVGHWAWVNPYGWTWVSDEPWGWATYHYGRWLYTQDYGWVWVPGTVWAPAWVAYRYGDPWVGWAPLPPGTNWRYDSGYDAALNQQMNIGTYAWTFVGLRYFAEPDLSSRYYVPAYNPYFMQRTEWSTRYAQVDGGIANVSIDPATVERVRGAPIKRLQLKEATSAEQGGVRVEGDSVVVYRPRLEAKAPSAEPPAPRRRGGKAEAEAWAAERREALKAHLERQRKALEEQDVAPPSDKPPADKPPADKPPSGKPPSDKPPADKPPADRPGAGMGPGAGPGPGASDDARARREAAMKALEEERKRMEEQIERRRRKMEEGQAQQPTPPPREKPPGMGEGPPAMGEDEDESGMGSGMGGGMK